jgi:hypothetical protein
LTFLCDFQLYFASKPTAYIPKNADNKGGEGAMIISGAIIPVGVKNKNGWGILDSEIQNVVATLKGKSLTVCPRSGDAHACDFDPKAEIGKMSDVWYDPFAKKIKAMAEITDSVAQRKINEGTWKPNWSVRLAAKENVDGWAKGVEGKNVTVVPEGAWPDANFNVLASNEEGFETFLIANFSVSAPAPSEPSNPTTRTVLGTVEYVPTVTNLNHIIGGSSTSSSTGSSSPAPEEDENLKAGENDSSGGNSMDEKDNTMSVEQLQAALAERDQKITDLEKKVTDFTAGQTDAIATKAKEIADQQITAYKASLARDAAIQDYVVAATKRGIKEVKTEMFDGMTAEQIGVFTASLKEITVPSTEDNDNLAGLKYPATTAEETGSLSVGIPSVGNDGKVTWVTSV